jgi:formamidopyrimidine-DNA glycosylase
MPELPEVETTVRGLVPVLEGRRLVRVEAKRADLRRAFPPDLRQRLTGATVTGLGRRAKYGLIDTDRGDTMVFHLGMSGRWRIDPAELGPHDHLLLETDAGSTLSLNDPRRFGSVDLVRTDGLEAWPTFASMGPEPLGAHFTADSLLQALDGRSAPIKAMLLDQRIVAGLGNIYVCEAFSRALLSPKRKASTIANRNGTPNDRAVKLIDAIKKVLQEAIEAGGSSLRDHRRTDGELGMFQHNFRVYDREGKPCPTRGCKGTIKRIVQNGRSTFFCPVCQK